MGNEVPLTTFAGLVQYSMDILGIFAFALSGAFLAVRKDFDGFGTIILAEVAGLGGGLFRDLVLGVRPVAFTDIGYYSAPVVAALLVFFSARIHRHARLSDAFDTCDLAALALFSVTGTVKALAYGFGSIPAMTLGLASAVGGGVLSSVLAVEVPALFQWSRDLYILPALTGSGMVVFLHLTGTLNGITTMAAALSAIGLRLISMYYGWHTPRAYVWRNPFSGMRQEGVPADQTRPDGMRRYAYEAEPTTAFPYQVFGTARPGGQEHVRP
jgi:uncharacterized membrane protein YeiH